jgi:hypothetical protein
MQEADWSESSQNSLRPHQEVVRVVPTNEPSCWSKLRSRIMLAYFGSRMNFGTESYRVLVEISEQNINCNNLR